jgi:hypothetical protein
MKKILEAYNNELFFINEKIKIYKNNDEDYFRKFSGISKEDYLFSKIPKLEPIEKKYTKEEIEEFPEKTISKGNLLINKINHFLEGEDERFDFLERMVHDLYFGFNNVYLED